MARGGGVQEIVRDYYRELVALGHDVRIITPRPQEDGDHYDKDGIIFLGNGTDFSFAAFQTTPTFSVSVDPAEIDAMLVKEKFDILHFHEPWVPILSRQILSRSKAINIATFHANLPDSVMSRTIAKVVTPYTKSVLKYLHALTAVSEAAAQYINSLTDEPVTIIPNGINLKHFKTLKHVATSKDKPKTILYLGRLEQRKGPKYLLKAYAELVKNQQDVELIIAGKGTERERLEAMVKELELPNVKFLGYVSDEEKLELFQSADLYCSPATHGESFGLVLLEAMACGLVTIAGDNPGYLAVMKETGALSIVNPRETDEFARRLAMLLNEEALRADWKKWAKEYIKQFDYPAIIKRYELLYQQALKNHPHRIKPFDDDEA